MENKHLVSYEAWSYQHLYQDNIREVLLPALSMTIDCGANVTNCSLASSRAINVLRKVSHHRFMNSLLVPSTNTFQHQQIHHNLLFHTSRKQPSSLATLGIQHTPSQVLQLHTLHQLFLLLSADPKQGVSLPCVTERRGASTRKVIQPLLILSFHILK